MTKNGALAGKDAKRKNINILKKVKPCEIL
jgi:hypothetical protein